MTTPKPLSADRPLEEPEYDRLGYAGFSRHLANSILKASPSDGLVIALHGAWGTGKTTALKFIVHYLEQQEEPPVVMWFNPWWFAGQEDLTRRFFAQFQATVSKSKLLKKRARREKLAGALSVFGDALANAPALKVIPFADEGAKAVGKAAKFAADKIVPHDIVALKDDIAKALESEATRIVIIVDDADRLVADEIRQLFRLIKAVGDFPSVTYLLAFDRQVAEKALDDVHPGAGEAYLEKIVQVSFELPAPDRLQLQSLFLERLNEILGETPDELFDEHLWGNLYVDGVEPFLAKPRDIVRLANALSVTYPAVCGEVHAVDFIGIETLRIFAPRAYSVVRANPDYFTGTGQRFTTDRLKSEEKQFHETWLKGVGERSETVRKLVGRLFPRFGGLFSNHAYGENSARAWRRQSRIASEEHFPVYFQLGLSPGEISTADVRQLLALSSDPGAVSARMIELAGVRRPDGHTRARGMLSRLHDQADEIPLGAIPGMVRGILDAGDEIIRADSVEHGALDPRDRFRIQWLVGALLVRLPLSDRGTVMRECAAHGRGLTAILGEVVDIGRMHGKFGDDASPAEDHLLDLATLEQIETIIALRIADVARSGELWSAVHPRALLGALLCYGDADLAVALVREHIADDDAFVAFLRSFLQAGRSRAIHDRVGRRVVKFDPLVLWGLVDDIDALEGRVSALLEKRRSAPEVETLEAFLAGCHSRRAGKEPR